MTLRSLVPSVWRREIGPISRALDVPFFGLDRLMDDLWSDFGMIPYGSLDTSIGGFLPSVDVKETDKKLVVTAELPGMEEKDVEVRLIDGHLTIKGEKKAEKEEKDEDYYYCERSYGSFNRVIALHDGLDKEHIEAHFKNGVLTVEIPKTEEAKVAEGTKIPIKAS